MLSDFLFQGRESHFILVYCFHEPGYCKGLGLLLEQNSHIQWRRRSKQKQLLVTLQCSCHYNMVTFRLVVSGNSHAAPLAPVEELQSSVVHERGSFSSAMLWTGRLLQGLAGEGGLKPSSQHGWEFVSHSGRTPGRRGMSTSWPWGCKGEMGTKIWFIVFRNWNSEQRIHCFASEEKCLPKYKLETKGHHLFQLKDTAEEIKKK